MRFVRREDWGAPATSPAPYIASTKGTKVHYLGSPYSSQAHTGCDDQVRAIRAAHLANTAEGYIDIAYNVLCCEHGYVFEGRGAHKKCGANGTSTLNTDHYAVCALLGSSGLTRPTDLMLHGLRDAIEWLRRSGAAGTEIKGHRDGWATACPGDPLYAWVRAGAPRPLEDNVTITDAEMTEIARKVLTLDGVIDNPLSPPSTNTHISLETAVRNIEIVARRTETTADAIAAQAAANGELLSQLMILLTDPANPLLAKLEAFLSGTKIQIAIDPPDLPTGG